MTDLRKFIERFEHLPKYFFSSVSGLLISGNLRPRNLGLLHKRKFSAHSQRKRSLTEGTTPSVQLSMGLARAVLSTIDRFLIRLCTTSFG